MKLSCLIAAATALERKTFDGDQVLRIKNVDEKMINGLAQEALKNDKAICNNFLIDIYSVA